MYPFRIISTAKITKLEDVSPGIFSHARLLPGIQITGNSNNWGFESQNFSVIIVLALFVCVIWSLITLSILYIIYKYIVKLYTYYRAVVRVVKAIFDNFKVVYSAASVSQLTTNTTLHSTNRWTFLWSAVCVFSRALGRTVRLESSHLSSHLLLAIADNDLNLFLLTTPPLIIHHHISSCKISSSPDYCLSSARFLSLYWTIITTSLL